MGGSRTGAVAATLLIAAAGCATRAGDNGSTDAVSLPPAHPAAAVADIAAAMRVAADLAVRLVSGRAPAPSALLVDATPALASALGRSGSLQTLTRSAAVVRAESVDDVSPGRIGIAVAVAVDGRERVLDELAVRTPEGWRVAEVLL
jgi:hypothetical protein